MTAITHVVQYSGGIGSWAAAQRVAAEHGTGNLVLLFADTGVEDDDLYRFLEESAAQLGAPLVRVADGRTQFEVFTDQRFLGNSRLAPCSAHLKQRPCRRWLEANADPARTVLHVGIDWSETRRLPAIVKGWAPWTVRFPMCDEPHLTKRQMLDWARALDVTPPRLYELGFAHNNCGGACVRAGQRQWKHLLATFPDRYAAAEASEQRIRADLGDVAILRERVRGESRPLTLTELRRRQQDTLL
ncbi:hypothetical protein [Actinomadura rubrisoli]|uniref:hypothetical protein n=1 Tax=Actinomadura rubrisoli TaxID=2530368 RepID=UPI001FB83543|nr:hypothetical protein [Actinomadura rubrisoli]